MGPLLAPTVTPSSCGSDGTSLSRYWLPSLDPPLVGAGQTSLERSNPLAGRTPFPFQILGGYLGRYLKGLFFLILFGSTVSFETTWASVLRDTLNMQDQILQ